MAALAVQWAVDSIFRRKLPLVLGIVLVCSIYTASTWTIYKNLNIPLQLILPWFFALFWVAVVAVILNNCHTSKSSPAKKIFTLLGPVGEFYLLFIILSVLYSFLVAGRDFPVVISGNNDIWDYSKLTSFILNKLTGNNISEFDLFKSEIPDQTPTAMLFLAAVSSLTGRKVFDILELGLILGMTGSAFIVKELCEKTWGITPYSAYLIAIVWVTSSFSYYLASNYFLAQWLGMSLFLVAILFLLSDERRLAIRVTTFCLFFYLIFMTYPALFFPYLGIFLFVTVVETVFSRRESGSSFFNLRLLSIFFSVPISLLVIYLLSPSHFNAMLARISVLSNAAAGWPFGLLNPLVLTSLPLTQSIDDDTVIHKLSAYCIVLVLISLFTYKAYRWKSLSAKQFSLIVLFVASIVVYLVYYMMKGTSYQQWKFAGSVVLPLAFLPILFVTSTFQSKKNISRLIPSVLLIGFLVANIVIMVHHAIHEEIAITRFSPLQALTRYERDPQVRSITIDLKSHFQSTMIATQFVNNKHLILWSASYFSPDKSGRFSAIPDDGLLLTDGCSIFNPRNMVMLGSLFCVFSGPPSLANKYSVRFNRPLPPFFTTKGLYKRERQGRWSEGRETVFWIPVNNEWQGVDLNIKGDPFLTQNLKKQRLSFSVHGIRLKEFSVSRSTEISLHIDHALFDDDCVELTINLPDSTAQNYGYTDPRILGFYFESLQVMAER